MLYEELIKRLREASGNHEDKCESCPYEEDYPCCVDCLDNLHMEAANAIEKLQDREIIVPDGHGRLIDADTLIQSIVKRLGIRSKEHFTHQESFVCAMIEDAPTVIPASEEEI